MRKFVAGMAIRAVALIQRGDELLLQVGVEFENERRNSLV